VDLSVSRSVAGAATVVAVSGDVDVHSAPELRDCVTTLFDDGERSVIVDLADVSFLDSTGLGALVTARTTAGAVGGTLPLVCVQERILRLFTITGLDDVFEMFATVDDSAKSLAASAQD
jgi:anti-sigma B factor antagonist